MGALRYSIEVVREANLGDHGERLRTSYPTVEGETVEDLILRAFPSLTAPYQSHNLTDEVVIKVMANPDGSVPDLTPKAAKARDPWAGDPL